MRDYAKEVKNPVQHDKLRVGLTIFVIVIAMLLPLSIYYFKYRNGLKQGLIARAHHPLKTATPVVTNKDHDAAAIQFDFYRLLPKMQVQVPAVADQTDSVENIYVLQVAALRTYQEANFLSQQLQELGLHAFVQTYQKQTEAWYRVMVGPYLSQKLALAAKKKLTQVHLTGLLVSLK